MPKLVIFVECNVRLVLVPVLLALSSTVLEKTWLLSAQFHQACCSWLCGCHRRGNVIRIFCDGCVANSDTPVAKMATFQSLGHLKQRQQWYRNVLVLILAKFQVFVKSKKALVPSNCAADTSTAQTVFDFQFGCTAIHASLALSVVAWLLAHQRLNSIFPCANGRNAIWLRTVEQF